jgi:hypothetical protein
MIRMFIPPGSFMAQNKKPGWTHPVPGYVKTNRSRDWNFSLALKPLIAA